jgi:taurine dioxygenase
VASYRRIEVKPIAGALGAEIANVDLSTLDDETFRQIEAAWLEHLVVFFRNQTLMPEPQIAFAKRFGEIHYHPFTALGRDIERCVTIVITPILSGLHHCYARI